jgi:hypothetical protein
LGALLAAPAQAQPTPPPAPANNSFKNLTARWWTWVYAQPARDVNGGTNNTFPILDKTGEFATAGQENGIGPANKYFFLAGTFGGDAERTVTVPQGKALFFPVINFEIDNAVKPPTNYDVPELKRRAEETIDSTTTHVATFDGVPVDNFRVESPVFDYTVPAENSIYDYFGLPFEGRIKPVVSDGYWAYIPPPTPGTHELTFTGANSSGFSVTVTYHLTVA